MTKRQEILADIRKYKGNALNITAVSEYLNVSRDTARGLLKRFGLSYVQLGKDKLFLAIDIARMIESMMIVNRR